MLVPVLVATGEEEEMVAYTLIPYSFSPLRTFIASMASGIGSPPLRSTPSISKANA